MKASGLALTAQFSLIYFFSVCTILGSSQRANGYDLEACIKDPMTTKPEKIDLLQPIDQKLINCVPGLSNIADKWKSQSNKIQSVISKLEIGNNGSSSIEKLEYNLIGNYISLVAPVKAAHTWNIKECAVPRMVPTYSTVKECAVPRMVPTYSTVKECAVPRMVTTYRTVKECAVPKMGQTGCAKKVFGKCIIPIIGQVGCVSWVNKQIPSGVRQDGCSSWLDKQIPSGVRQDGCSSWLDKQIPSGVRQDGCSSWLDKPISVSTTCTYDFTLNISTGESKPVFSCGRGSLGEYKVDASVVTAILNGEMPSMGKILTSVSFTPPLFTNADRDDYEKVKNKIISDHPDSIVYFSSQSFVNWASTKNQAANGVIAFVTGGSYGAEVIRQIEERLRTELTFMGIFTTQTGMQLGTEQIVSMMTGKSTLDLKGYRVSVKVVNTPEIVQKCIVNGDCIPAIKLPRLGFAIIATKI
jgi:hypothetical protein